MERELFTRLMCSLMALPQARRRPAKSTFHDHHVLAVWLWAVLHERPISWATRRVNWPVHDRLRPLPSDATMSRRLRDPQLLALIQTWGSRLGPSQAPGDDRPWVLDGKPLPVSGHSQDRDAGVGRTSGGMGRGYKLHAIVDLDGDFKVFTVEPLNVSEQAAAHTLLDRLPPRGDTRRLLADGNYDSNKLYDHAPRRGLSLVAARRYPQAKGLGHHRHSPHRLAALEHQRRDPEVLRPRRRIEGHFGTLGNAVAGLAPLPNHVRSLRRVRLWVHGKLLIHAAHQQRRRQRKKVA